MHVVHPFMDGVPKACIPPQPHSIPISSFNYWSENRESLAGRLITAKSISGASVGSAILYLGAGAGALRISFATPIKSAFGASLQQIRLSSPRARILEDQLPEEAQAALKDDPSPGICLEIMFLFVTTIFLPCGWSAPSKLGI